MKTLNYKHRKPNEIAYDCEKCGGKLKKDVNPQKGVFHCHKCGFSGRLGGRGVRNYEKGGKCSNPPLFQPVSLPSGSVPLAQNAYVMAYALERGARDRVIDLFAWAKWGEGWRLVIPVYEGGVLVSYVARSISGAEPKDLNPPSSMGSKGQYLYGLDTLEKGDKVIVTEGVFDTWHLQNHGYKSVALMGSQISPVQIGKLLATRPSEIIVFLDGDEIGIKKGWEVGCALRARAKALPVKDVHIGGSDPDEVQPRELRKLIGDKQLST